MNTTIDKTTITRIEDFIKTLSVNELVYMNKIVVERAKMLRQIETFEPMTNFVIGDRVQFRDTYGTVLTARVIKMNKKTISVITNDNHQWNVSPGALTRI
ncbi:MAG: hypothetical protein HQ557_19855 [Bacteroidetes bacterium]|nr:hypothetical protein [Bacteroidota bacterium]